MGLLDGVLGDLVPQAGPAGDDDHDQTDSTGSTTPSSATSSVQTAPQKTTTTSSSITNAGASPTTTKTDDDHHDGSDDESDNERDDEDDEKEEKQSTKGSTTTNRAAAQVTSSISSAKNGSFISTSVPPPPISSAANVTGTATPGLVNATEIASSGPNITSASSVYPASWTKMTSGTVTVSTLIIAGSGTPATLAQGNNAIKDENIFHTHNKLFPLAIIAVIVAGIFFLMTAAFIFLRLLGWNRKRRTRKLTPSFFPVDRNTMFEPKFDGLGTTGNIVAATGPYNPIASTVDLHRNGSQSSIGSDRAFLNVPPGVGPASTRPPGGDGYGPEGAYDGAFFPSQPVDNPFLKPGEYSYPTLQPNMTRTLLSSYSSGQTGQTQASKVGEEPGSPVPSFNTGRVFAQLEPQARQAPNAIGIPSVGASIPPPYSTPHPGERVNLHDEYKFNMLQREPSNGSHLMSRTRAMNPAGQGSAGARLLGSNPASVGDWQEGRRGNGRRISADEESLIASEVTTKSSKLGKQPTWGSDRV